MERRRWGNGAETVASRTTTPTIRATVTRTKVVLVQTGRPLGRRNVVARALSSTINSDVHARDIAATTIRRPVSIYVFIIFALSGNWR